eukprot:356396-Chlamydomonas_euryale.AAC.2
MRKPPPPLQHSNHPPHLWRDLPPQHTPTTAPLAPHTPPTHNQPTHLWRHIPRRAAKRVGAAAWLHDLCKPEVAELGVALRVDEHVLRLEVAEHKVVVVQVLQRQHDRRNVKLCQWFLHALVGEASGGRGGRVRVGMWGWESQKNWGTWVN